MENYKIKTPKKTIKDFKKVFDNELQKNLNSPYNYTRENATKSTLHYCYGYFQKDNTNIFKIIEIILKAL